MSEELDRKLKSFLEDKEAEKRDGFTNKGIANALFRHAEETKKSFDHVHKRIDSHNTRLENLEADTEKLDKELEDTGRHNIEALKTAAEARGIAIGKAHRSLPPLAMSISKVVNSTVGKIISVVLLLLVGWLSRHLGLKP